MGQNTPSLSARKGYVHKGVFVILCLDVLLFRYFPGVLHHMARYDCIIQFSSAVDYNICRVVVIMLAILCLTVQLGHGDTVKKTRPVQIAALADKSVVSVACGQYHSLALDDDHR